MFLFRNVTFLDADADVRSNYSRVQRECVCCSHFSKDVKEVLYFEIFFASSIAIKKWKKFRK